MSAQAEKTLANTPMPPSPELTKAEASSLQLVPRAEREAPRLLYGIILVLLCTNLLMGLLLSWKLLEAPKTHAASLHTSCLASNVTALASPKSKAVFKAAHSSPDATPTLLSNTSSVNIVAQVNVTRIVRYEVSYAGTSRENTTVAAGVALVHNASGFALYEVHTEIVTDASFGEYASRTGGVGDRSLQIRVVNTVTSEEAILVPFGLSMNKNLTLLPNFYAFSHRSTVDAEPTLSFMSTVSGQYAFYGDVGEAEFNSFMLPVLAEYGNAWESDNPQWSMPTTTTTTSSRRRLAQRRRRLDFESWVGGKVGSYLGSSYGGSFGGAVGGAAGKIATGANAGDTLGVAAASYAGSELGGSWGGMAAGDAAKIAEGGSAGSVVGGSLGYKAGAAIGSDVGGDVGGYAGAAIGSAVGGPIGGMVGEEVGHWAGSEVGSYLGGEAGGDIGSSLGQDMESDFGSWF